MINNIRKVKVSMYISNEKIKEIDDFLNGRSEIRIELSNYHSIKRDTLTSFETILEKYPSHTLVTLKASELLPTWAATALKQAGKNPNKEKRLEVDWLQRGCSLLQNPTQYPPVEG